jgi:hypothetical protein
MDDHLPAWEVDEIHSLYHFRSDRQDLATGLQIHLWQDILPINYPYEYAYRDFAADYEQRHPGLVDWESVQVTYVPF